MSYEVKVLGPADVTVMRGLLSVFGQAFEDTAAYCSRQPDDGYLARLLGSPTFIAVAALHGPQVVGGLASTSGSASANASAPPGRPRQAPARPSIWLTTSRSARWSRTTTRSSGRRCSAACLGCHDSSAVRAHFASNTAPDGAEACSICHDPGEFLDAKQAHFERKAPR